MVGGSVLSSSNRRRVRRGAWQGVLVAVVVATNVAPAHVAHAAEDDPGPLVAAPLAAAPVSVLNDNGAWSWFQDDRAIITTGGELLVGSTASAVGAGGAGRTGAVEVTTADAATLAVRRIDRLYGAGAYRPDDHNAPALIELPSRRIVAAWAGHNDDRFKRTATLDATDVAWTLNAPSRRGSSTTYANLVRLGAENGGRGRLYDLYRAESQAVNAMVSDDDGRTWSYGGILVRNSPLHPYTKFASNGTDRIHFVSSAGNPNGVRGSSVRSGYLQGGAIYATDGRQVGTLGTGAAWADLTPVELGIAAPEGADTDVWTSDLALGPGGPVAVLTVKHPRPPQVDGRTFEQEYRYARWDGAGWVVSHLAWGGSELFSGEPSYTGNLSIDRTDPARVFLSSNVDPRTGQRLVSAADGRSHWEIYEARTGDAGATWSLAAVTRDSSVDNLRPIHASGHGRAALVWMRGTYPDFVRYQTEVVGVIDRPGPGPASPTPVRRRVPRTQASVAGRWQGGAHHGLFVVGADPAASGFLLPAGRGERQAFVHVPLDGAYVPHRFDVEGDGRDEVLLHDPTGARGARVVGIDASGAVVARPWASRPWTIPVVGDVDGDGRTDILWYQPGPGPDDLHLGNGTVRRLVVNGFYRPASGDFDGDGRADIAWHAPGSPADFTWYATGGGGFASVRRDVSGSYRPLAADVDGDGRDDLVWQSGSLSVASHVWRSTGRAFRSSPWPATTTLAIVGDLDGDGRDDLFFDRRGDTVDAWWWAAAP